MSKKLLIYGLAFGSASAALSYIYLTSAVYKSSNALQVIFILGEFIIIPAIAIYLFLRAFKNESPQEFTIGKAVFMGFFLSVIISAAVSLVYSYIYQFKPEFIAWLTDYKVMQYSRNESVKAMTDKVAFEKEMTEYRAFVVSHSTVRQNFLTQLFLGASRGLFFSAIFAYLMRPKNIKSN